MRYIKRLCMLLLSFRFCYARANPNVSQAAAESSCDTRPEISHFRPNDTDEMEPGGTADSSKRMPMREKCSAGRFRSRDLSPLEIDHYSYDPNARINGDPAAIYSNTSDCKLQPDVDPGSFYLAQNKTKQLLREAQLGLNMILDIQIVDSSTCEPLKNVLVDVWHCNATGVYSGVLAQGNGNNADLKNLDNSFFRGLYPTSHFGVAKFSTIFPGHVENRTNHVNFLTRASAYDSNNATLESNSSTIMATHLGQIFFDQALIDTVERLPPYTDNLQLSTTNKEDPILKEQAQTNDPIMEYFWVSTVIVEEGIIAWVTIGIDQSNRIEVPAAGTKSNGDVQSNGTDNSGISIVPVPIETASADERSSSSGGSAISTTIPSSGGSRLRPLF